MYDRCFVSHNMMRYCIVFIANFNYAPLVSRIIVRENRVVIARFSKPETRTRTRRSFAKRNTVRPLNINKLQQIMTFREIFPDAKLILILSIPLLKLLVKITRIFRLLLF